MFQTPKKFDSKPAKEITLDEVLGNTKPTTPGHIDAALEATEAVKKEKPPLEIMTFGKYQGRRIDTLPTSYLYWLLTIDLDQKLRDAVLELLRFKKPEAPVEPPIPKGFKRLPAGVLRKVRVNRAWIKDNFGKPVIVVENNVEIQYDEVIIEGQCQMSTKRDTQFGCGWQEVKNTAHIETKSSLLVK